MTADAIKLDLNAIIQLDESAVTRPGQRKLSCAAANLVEEVFLCFHTVSPSDKKVETVGSTADDADTTQIGMRQSKCKNTSLYDKRALATSTNPLCSTIRCV